VERAIFAGDHETGVCVMGLEEGLDTGPVYGCEHLAIGPHESADELRSRLVAAGSDLLVRTLTEGLGEPVAQEGEATYAAKLEASDLKLDWDRSAIELYRMVRVGGAWTTFRGRRLKVLQARLSEVEADQPTPGTIVGTTVAAGEGALELVEVQPEGKAAQPATAWRNGARPAPGDALGG
jgi:methionyl-tRNA formyltransferase